ncbi:MAG: fibronectin type III domain-containing protein [Candidatus Latescibacterota bacterium]|nr:MAG: fibronectin type III domain-containing protein [Candidatus Latescibacterota bacterium]
MTVPSRRWFVPICILSIGLIAILFVSCGEEQSPKGPDLVECVADTIPPALVTDLSLKSPTLNSLVAVWTATGDDGMKGTASLYDIRYSTSPITEENWESLTRVEGEPSPGRSGQLENVRVGGLEPGTSYFFSLKTSDEMSNESGLSNVATGATLQESSPPSNVTDLVATAIGESSFTLAWTAPGDDGMTGTASQYDMRYSTWPITEQDWGLAARVEGEPPPKPAGRLEVLTVDGLEPETNYFFALKTSDDVPNWSGLSNAAPGLGYNAFLWVYPDVIHKGDTINIVYRVTVEEPVILSFTANYLYECGDRTLRTLVEGTYPTGIFSLVYDFYDTVTRDYYPATRYYFSLCWGSEHKMKTDVWLRE